MQAIIFPDDLYFQNRARLTVGNGKSERRSLLQLTTAATMSHG
jgi:hypothetical protein